jgi:hypothetical protein
VAGAQAGLRPGQEEVPSRPLDGNRRVCTTRRHRLYGSGRSVSASSSGSVSAADGRINAASALITDDDFGMGGGLLAACPDFRDEIRFWQKPFTRADTSCCCRLSTTPS